MVGLNCVLIFLALGLYFKPTLTIRIGGLFSNQYSFAQTSEILQKKIETILFSARRNTLEGSETDRRISLAFEFSVLMLNKHANDFAFNKIFTHNILSYKDGPLQAFDQATQACDQLRLGVAGIVGFKYSSYVQSVCHAKEMPYIYVQRFSTPLPQAFNLSNPIVYSFQMSPTSRTMGRALADLIIYYRWTNLAVVFCKHSESFNIEDLLQYLVVDRQIKITLLRIEIFQEEENVLDILKIIKLRQIKNIVLDCSPHHTLFRILTKALEMDLLSIKFNYILVGLRETLSQYVTYISNIPLTEFTTGAALVYDGMQMYGRALASVYDTEAFRHRSLLCTDDKKWDFGNILARSMGKTNFVGMTGPIKFDKWGSRVDVELDVLSITYTGLVKVGEWKDVKDGTSEQRLNMFEPLVAEKTENSSLLFNKTFVVTTIVESPYIFRHNTTSNESIYSGYCIDLLQLLAEDVGFSYKLVEVSDGEYGSMRADGSWDGLIGELRSGFSCNHVSLPELKKYNLFVSRRIYAALGHMVQRLPEPDNPKGIADMAVAPLTITYDREKATCFTKPYMSLGVGILYRKPSLGNPSLFGFLNPLSLQIWILVLVSYLLVSFLMYFIARLSPYESTQPPNNSNTSEESNFGVMNSLWYGAGALMQQGSDFNPRSMSTRLLAAVWWFFSLIFISSYTANLAAFLTVTRMEVEISSADDLAAQTKIKYGTLEGGSTTTFFRNSKIGTYSKMWQYLNSTNDVFVKTNHEGVKRVQQGGYAYLMESTTMEYIISQDCNLTQVGGLLDARGYGVATMDPSLRDKLSVAILKLQEKGILDELKQKWWNHNATQCPIDVKSNTQSLTIANLGGAFVFLAIGALVAITAAILEYAIDSHIRARKREMKNMEDANGCVHTMDQCDYRTEHLTQSLHKPEQPANSRYLSRCSKVFQSGPMRTSKQKHVVGTRSCNNHELNQHRTETSAMSETVLSDINAVSENSKQQIGQKRLEKLKYLPLCKFKEKSEASESSNRKSLLEETNVGNKSNFNNYCNTKVSSCLLPNATSYDSQPPQHRSENQQCGACSALPTKVSLFRQTNM